MADLDQIKSLLAAALLRPEGERRRFVEEHSALSLGIREEVLRLLRARDNAPDLLAAGALSKVLGPSPELELPIVGDVLGDRYLIESVLSATPTSYVLLALDQRLEQAKVVVKMVHGGGLQQFQNIREDLWQEIRMIARVSHPGVSGLVDEGVWRSNYPYVVLHYWRGQPLRSLLSEGPVTVERALIVLVQIADILDACHSAGIMHLDLKPENIVVYGSSIDETRVTVVDFGLAQVERVRGSGRVAGTPHYWAPEQLEGGPCAQSDIFALARVSEELLPNATSSVRRAIRAGLVTNPQERPRSACAWAHGVQGAVSRQATLRRVRQYAVALAILALIVGAFWTFRRPADHPVTFRALTTLKGVEFDPEFSPDGNLLFFSHGPNQNGPRSIYSLDVKTGRQFRLTSEDFRDGRPRISPDGKQLVFIRDDLLGQVSLVVMSPRGGVSRVVHQGVPQSVVFTPDSRALLFTEWIAGDGPCALHKLDLETGNLTVYDAPAGSRGDIDLALSPDGRQLAFARYKVAEIADIYVQEVSFDGSPQGQPRRVTWLARRAFQPRWYPDGRNLVFVAGTLTDRRLWKINFADQMAVELTSLGTGIEQAAVSPQGQLAFVKNREDCDLWRFEFSEKGSTLIGAPFLSSTAGDEEAQFSPDGRKVGFFSERSGSLQAWISDAGGSSPQLLTKFSRAEKAWLSWSKPDVLSVFARIPGSGPEVYQTDGLAPHSFNRVFAGAEQERVVGISRDGQFVYLCLSRGEHMSLERQSLRDGRRTVIAPVDVGFLKESEDRAWLYYSRQHEGKGLFRMRSSGGEEIRIVEKLSRRNTFALRGNSLFYASPMPQVGIYRLGLNDGHRELLMALDRVPGWGMDVSPNGREILLPLYEFDDADILMTDNLP